MPGTNQLWLSAFYCFPNTWHLRVSLLGAFLSFPPSVCLSAYLPHKLQFPAACWALPGDEDGPGAETSWIRERTYSRKGTTVKLCTRTPSSPAPSEALEERSGEAVGQGEAEAEGWGHPEKT